MNDAPLRGVFFCLNHDPKLPWLNGRWLFTLIPDCNAHLRWFLSKADFIGPAAEASDLSAVIHLNGRFCSGYLSFRQHEFSCLLYDAQISKKKKECFYRFYRF